MNDAFCHSGTTMVENNTWYVGAWSSKVAIILLVSCPKAEAEVDKNVELKWGIFYYNSSANAVVQNLLYNESSSVPVIYCALLYILMVQHSNAQKVQYKTEHQIIYWARPADKYRDLRRL